MGIPVVALVSVGMFVILIAIIGGTLILFRLFGGRNEKRNPANDAEEIRIMQETYKSLQKMESRIEALETILLEGEKSDKEEG